MSSNQKPFEEARREAMALLNSLTDKLAQQRAAAFINAAVVAERERCIAAVAEARSKFKNENRWNEFDVADIRAACEAKP